MKKIDIIVPCYNEEAVLRETSHRLYKIINKLIKNNVISDESKIIFVDDGSKDNTWAIIKELSLNNNIFKGIKLSRNRGHQNALLAGLQYTKADAAISIDADLQDDVNIIPEMIHKFLSGIHIVYAARKKRKTDSFFKRNIAQTFYRLMLMMGIEVVYNHADYRLMSREVLDALKQYKEVNMFLRGIIPDIGFLFDIVYFDRDKRFAGEAKYNFRSSFALAVDGITSFSITPLRIITFLGFVIFIISLIVTFWVIYIRLFTDKSVPGWASTVLPIYFIGGIQILSLGIIGEYIGKIYLETKARPRYFIEELV